MLGFTGLFSLHIERPSYIEKIIDVRNMVEIVGIKVRH